MALHPSHAALWLLTRVRPRHSTRILGRHTAPFPPFLSFLTAARMVSPQDPSTDSRSRSWGTVAHISLASTRVPWVECLRGPYGSEFALQLQQLALICLPLGWQQYAVWLTRVVRPCMSAGTGCGESPRFKFNHIFPRFLISHRVPYGFTQDPSTRRSISWGTVRTIIIVCVQPFISMHCRMQKHLLP